MITTIIWLVTLLIFAFLAGSNWETTTLSYVVGEIRLPLAIVIISSVLLGVIISTAITLGQRARQIGTIRQMQKRLEACNRRLAELNELLDKHESLAAKAAEEQYDNGENNKPSSGGEQSEGADL